MTGRVGRSGAERRAGTGSVRTAVWLTVFVIVSLAIGAIGGWPGLASRTGLVEAGETRPERVGAAEPAGAGWSDGPGDAAGGSAPEPSSGSASPSTGALPGPVLRPEERPRVGDAALERRVEGLVAEAVRRASSLSGGRADGSTVAVALRVVDLSDGALVLERLPRTPMAPASNMKLVTSLAALVSLGADHRLVTRVDARGELRDGRLAGDLVVRAGGDPLVDRDDPSFAERRLAELARQVASVGVEIVEGDLVLDLGGFADAADGPGWPEPNARWQRSYALAAGLSVNGGAIDFVIEPTRAGRTARSAFHPAPTGLTERHEVRTVAGRANKARLGSYESRSLLELEGEIGADCPPYAGDCRHLDPVLHFSSVLQDQLGRAGVEVLGQVRRERGVPEGREVARIETSLADLLVPINTHSDNGAADALLMVLGLERFGRGDRESGAARVREVLAGLGADTADFVQVGGSGLSRDNRVTVEILSELLARVALTDPSTRDPFVASLAVAGRSGTLERRMTGRAAGRVHAKTGFIEGASALSGYVATEEGRQLAFSILVSYPRIAGLNNSCWKPMHDAIAEELVAWTRP